MPLPFYGEKFTFSQPDGSQLEVRGWGDQHHAVFETLDGYTVVQNPNTGYFEYASLTDDAEDLEATGIRAGAADPGALRMDRGIRIRRDAARLRAMNASNLMVGRRRCEIRRQRTKSALRATMTPGGPVAAPPERETTGVYVGLCLLIQFPDVPETISREEVDDFCNKQGYDGFGNNGSVYDYFLDNSGGKFEYTNVVAPYYTSRNPREYYTNESIPYGTRARQLIREALTYHKAQGFDFSGLTADEDGYLYALSVFHAGRRVNNWAKGLWPHASSLSQGFSLAPGLSAYDYQITDMGTQLTLATFCHENGHMVCDYPDLYDYGYESKGVGDYCLMCSGGSNRKNPTQICAYLKYKSGWSETATTITPGMQPTLSAGKNEFCLYTKNRTEYFIIENRRKSGRDESLPDSGLTIWHVDEMGSNNHEQMTESEHYECSLEQADSRFDLEHGVNRGDGGDLFHAPADRAFGNSTNPTSKWWTGAASGLEIVDISSAGPDMSFRFYKDDEDDGGGTFREESAPKKSIPDNDAAGIRDSITFADAATVVSVKVEVDIKHTYRGDLRVTLQAPSGRSVVLHDRKGGRLDDLKATFDEASTPGLSDLTGENLTGDWTLHVQDLARRDEGRLNRWSLEIEGVADAGPVELEGSPGKDIPDNEPNGIAHTLKTDASGSVAEVSVSVDITHTFIADLIVTLISPSNTNVDLHRRAGGSADNIIRVYDFASTPGLQQLRGQPVAGKWKLKVADVAGRDLGKLNHWRLRILRDAQ